MNKIILIKKQTSKQHFDERNVVGMRRAYDTILQSEVAAGLVGRNGRSEPYRYECACCGEEVYIAAAHSTSMVPHFRHRNGNNDVECENYLGQYGVISVDSRSRKSNRERVEFYFEKNTRTFSIGLRFSCEEIDAYEKQNVIFELRSSSTEHAFFTLPINNMSFAPEFPTLIPVGIFSLSYYLSNTADGLSRKYDFFKSGDAPVFFKILGNDSAYRAKLVRSAVIYTNVRYFLAFCTQNSVSFSNDICVEDTFPFETMAREFQGRVLIIRNKTARIDALLLSWGYQLEASETLTLLWPPAALVDDVSVIRAGHAFLYSTFELQSRVNINVDSEDIHRITNEISKVSVKPKTKVLMKNAEIIIDKGEHHPYNFDDISSTESSASTYIIPDDNTYFLFNRSGVKRLSKGQSVSFTPRDEVKSFYYGYLKNRIYLRQPKELTGEYLLNDILTHYRRTEGFDKTLFTSRLLSKMASQYIEKCEASGLINVVAKQFIEEGLL